MGIYGAGLGDLSVRLYEHYLASGSALSFPEWLDAMGATETDLLLTAQSPVPEQPEEEQDQETEDTEEVVEETVPEEIPEGEQAEEAGAEAEGGNDEEEEKKIWEIVTETMEEHPWIYAVIASALLAIIALAGSRRYLRSKKETEE